MRRHERHSARDISCSSAAALQRWQCCVWKSRLAVSLMQGSFDTLLNDKSLALSIPCCQCVEFNVIILKKVTTVFARSFDQVSEIANSYPIWNDALAHRAFVFSVAQVPWTGALSFQSLCVQLYRSRRLCALLRQTRAIFPRILAFNPNIAQIFSKLMFILIGDWIGLNFVSSSVRFSLVIKNLVSLCLMWRTVTAACDFE